MYVAGAYLAAIVYFVFLVNYPDAPFTPQERWENQSGYSPATIAAEIAGLVSAARIARRDGDTVSAGKYLATADAWQKHVQGWTATTNGPYSPRPYYLRLTKDGDPNAATAYNIGDSGPDHVDQRAVVDPSFLELVRLGIEPADDPVIRNTLAVVDAKLGVSTPNGEFWHRYTFDGYGEQRDGALGRRFRGRQPDDDRARMADLRRGARRVRAGGR